MISAEDKVNKNKYHYYLSIYSFYFNCFKTHRALLMEQIKSLRPTGDQISVSKNKAAASEAWQVLGGDSITIKLVPKEVNFFYKNRHFYIINILAVLYAYRKTAVK